MADKRNIRRDAERKAREALGGDLVTTVGDLAMATAERTSAAENVTQARARSEELITAANQQADNLLAAAQDSLDSVEKEYGKSYNAAREAGWTTTRLRSMGYSRPATRKHDTGQTAKDKATADSAMSAAS